MDLESHAGIEFHFRNCCSTEQIHVRVHHHGCGGAPWHDGRACCWSKDLDHNPTGGEHSVYNPASFVVNFDKWMAVLKDGFQLIKHAGMFIETEGIDIEVLAEMVADCLKITKDIALAELSKVDLSKAHQSLDNACESIGVTKKQIQALARRLEIHPNSTFIAGPTYDALIRCKEGTSPVLGSSHGWSCMHKRPSKSGDSNLRLATGAFLYRDALIYAVDPGMPQLWMDF